MNNIEIISKLKTLYSSSDFKGLEDLLLDVRTHYDIEQNQLLKYYFHEYSGKLDSHYNKYDCAFENYKSALKVAQNMTDSKIFARAYNSIGRWFGKLHNYAKSKENFLLALQYDNSSSSVLNNLGLIEVLTGNPDAALSYYKQSLELCLREKKYTNAIINLYNTAEIYFQKSLYSDALNRLDFAIEICNENEIDKLLNNLYGLKANCLVREGKIEEAKSVFNPIINELNETDNLMESLDFLRSVSEFLYEIGDYKNAYEYYTKLNKIHEKMSVRHATQLLSDTLENFQIEKKELIQYNKELRKKSEQFKQKFENIKNNYSNLMNFGSLGAYSKEFREIVLKADSLHVNRNIPVLIEGETGTGKDVVAKIIHFGKEWSNLPFVPINCAAIPETLIDSELFGYEKGAFTNANKKGALGKLELASSGTIFFDEVGDLPLSVQAKLLRVLQERQMYRVGGTKLINIDIRVVCATNQNLAKKVEQGLFREDLYYRLNGSYINIPPLRKRRDEIVPLATMFLLDYSKKKNKKFRNISDEAADLMLQYSWKGNVRELKSVIERAALLYDSENLEVEHLDINLETDEVNSSSKYFEIPKDGIDFGELESQLIQRIYRDTGNNVMQTAKILKISRNKVYRNVKKLEK
jgi:transcriptional regulator with PAS, ATPase and Fis domain